MQGYFDLGQVLRAVVDRCPDARHLRIATLCYSKRNAADLCDLLEARPGLALTLLVSDFFVQHNRDGHAEAVAQLSAFPDVRIGAARSHCKVATLDDPAGGLVLEGSANLRTNKNWEQLCATRAQELHDWHAGWIDALVKAAHEREEEERVG